MWNYEKRLEYPINITKANPQMARLIISQFGGPDGEKIGRRAGEGALSEKGCCRKRIAAGKEPLPSAYFAVIHSPVKDLKAVLRTAENDAGDERAQEPVFFILRNVRRTEGREGALQGGRAERILLQFLQHPAAEGGKGDGMADAALPPGVAVAL